MSPQLEDALVQAVLMLLDQAAGNRPSIARQNRVRSKLSEAGYQESRYREQLRRAQR